MAETPVIPQEMSTVQDHSGDTSSPSPQEMTTVQDDVSTDAAGSLQIDSSFNLQLSIQLPFHITIICFTILGNLLLIKVLNNLPNSKLRRTTKVLMRYVSVSHCLMSVAVLGRLFNMPCWIVLLVVMNSVFNVQCGSTYLGYEVLIMVIKPYNHQRFISMNICKVGILISYLASVCFNVVAYLTMKEPDDPSCHIGNGVLNPVFACIYMVVLNAIIIATSTMLISTLKAMKRVFPGTGTLNINVIHVAPVNINANQDAPVYATSTAATPGQNFPLKKLTKMLTCSLLCSIICWFPNTTIAFIFSILDMLQVEVGSIKRQISVGSGILVALNGVFYVIVYLTMSSQIRQAVKTYLSSWLCQSTGLFGSFCAKCNPWN